MTTSTLDAPRIAEQTTEETAIHESNGHANELPHAEQSAEVVEPTPPPSPTELRALHYQEITAMGEKVYEARMVWESLKKDASDAKKEFDGLTVQLLRLMRRDPLQRQLPIENDANLEAANSTPPLPANTEWRKLAVADTLTQHGVSKHGVELLEQNHLGTLGDLQDFWQSGKRLLDVKGIGEGMNARIVDAFAEYGAAHPEVFGEQPESTPDDEPQDAGE